MKPRNQLVTALIAGVLAIGSAQALAAPPQDGGYGPGYGPGMMYGYGGGYPMGPGMMYGYGGGYPMGPGMMYGYGRGYYGMGPGMMWGYGPGYGVGYGPGLDLSDGQRSKIADIQQNLHGKQFALMGKMQQIYARGFDPEDTAAAQKAYKEIAALRQQMFNNALAAHKQVDAVLTKEQREQLQRGRN